MDFLLIGLFVIVGSIKNFMKEIQFENKLVRRFMYKMIICAKIHIFRNNIMKILTNNNLP